MRACEIAPEVRLDWGRTAPPNANGVEGPVPLKHSAPGKLEDWLMRLTVMRGGVCSSSMEGRSLLGVGGEKRTLEEGPATTPPAPMESSRSGLVNASTKVNGIGYIFVVSPEMTQNFKFVVFLNHV